MLEEPKGGFPLRLLFDMCFRQCSRPEQIWMQESLRSLHKIDVADLSGRGVQLKWGHWLRLVEDARKLLHSSNPPSLPDAKLMEVHGRIVLRGPLGKPKAASPKPSTPNPKPSVPNPDKRKRPRDKGIKDTLSLKSWSILDAKLTKLKAKEKAYA